jgi:16S rRNA processing protein RimM
MSQKLVDARSVGIIGKPHGIKGELNVMLLTDYPDSIFKGSVLYLDDRCKEEILVESIYRKKVRGRESAVIKFKDIDSRNEAETLRGKGLYRSRHDSPALEEGEFWIDDLKGCRVFLRDGKDIGIVEEVEVLPSNENLVVGQKASRSGHEEGRGRSIYIPLVDEYIHSIDISKRTVVIKKIPEYI